MATNVRTPIDKPASCPYCKGTVSVGLLELIGRIYVCNFCGFVIGRVRE